MSYAYSSVPLYPSQFRRICHRISSHGKVGLHKHNTSHDCCGKAVNTTMQPSATQKENIAITIVKAFGAGLQRQQCQPEEERRFRSNQRIEEHLLAANMVIDKTLLANTMLWIVSLDLSTTFRRIGIHCGSIAVSLCFSSSNLAATNDIW